MNKQIDDFVSVCRNGKVGIVSYRVFRLGRLRDASVACRLAYDPLLANVQYVATDPSIESTVGVVLPVLRADKLDS